MSETKKVYEAINRITAELARIGIAKDSKNTDQGFMFRGIDAVYQAVAPLLAKEKLCILPAVVARECAPRQTASGKTTYNVAVKVEFSFVSSEDGSAHIVTTCGEANDQQDKATNKAMSAAYKYACFQAFCIPTEGDNDADSHGDAVWESTVVDFLSAIDAAVDAEAGKQVYKDALPHCKKHEDVNAANKLKARLLERFPELKAAA